MDLRPLLEPRSVAVVGATDRPGSYANTVFMNLERAGFEGQVWGVHPTRESVRGRACFPSVGQLPEAVDAVVVAIPAAGVPAVIAAAGERGCGGAIVFAAGFGEVAAGAALELDLRRAALDADLPVCGPNGNGVVAVGARSPLWGDSVPALSPGRVAMVSQSGNVAVNAIGSRRGIDFHTLVSTGNQAVLDASDWLGALAEADGVGSVALFLEADGDGAKLAEALALCAERRIGVAVLKVGSSAAGARAAAAHTGALAADQRVFRALIEEAGAAWAADPHELLELARALAEPRARPRGDGGLAVLTCSGGDSGVAADEAETIGTELPALSPATATTLEQLLPPAATIANPLDFTSLIWGDTDRLRRIAAAVGDDPSIDQLLLCYDHPQGLSPDHEAEWAAVREGLAAGAAQSNAGALFAATLPDLLDPEIARELGARGIPAVAGLRTALVCTQALRRPTADPARLREIAAATARARDSNGAAGWLGEADAKQLLRDASIAVPAGRVAADADDAVAVAHEIGWPVAMKLSAPSLLHKTEAGALALALSDEAMVREADARLRSLPVASGAEVLVERMAAGGIEVFVSVHTDGVVPSLAIGLGGVWAEVFDDVAIVPLPADHERIGAALRSLRAAPLLIGGRGTPAVDLEGLAEFAARVGAVALDRRLALLELNPVAVGSDGAVALDALARAA